MKKKACKTLAAASAFAMVLTLLPAGSAQAAAIYLPTRSVTYKKLNGKWVKNQSEKISCNKKGLRKLVTGTSYAPDGSKSGSDTKSVYTYSGRKLRSFLFYNGSSYSSETYKYDKKGRLVKAGTADPANYTTYKYKGKSKKPVSSTSYYGEMKLNSIKYSYKKNTEIRSITYGGGKAKETFYFNKNRKLIKWISSFPDDKSTTIYKYDKKGNVIKQTKKSTYGTVITKTSYKYYKKKFIRQKITKQTSYDQKGQVIDTWAYKTVYSGFKKYKVKAARVSWSPDPAGEN